MDRRKFLKAGIALSAGSACTYGLPLLPAFKSIAASERIQPAENKWGMVIDLNKCLPNCTACLDACRKENNVAYHSDPRWDIHWIRKVTIRNKHADGLGEKTVPLLCNHCEEPPCALVCPVQATYKRADGIVIVDHHRCIGCRYCMAACPYGARSFNWKDPRPFIKEIRQDFPTRTNGVVEKCSFCEERLAKGLNPACVEACTAKGLAFGDLNEPESQVRNMLTFKPSARRKAHLGTEPKVFYLP